MSEIGEFLENCNRLSRKMYRYAVIRQIRAFASIWIDAGPT